MAGVAATPGTDLLMGVPRWAVHGVTLLLERLTMVAKQRAEYSGPPDRRPRGHP
jgi:hypothetical protein